MDINVHLYVHSDSSLGVKLDQILQQLDVLKKGELNLMVDLSALQSEVTKNTDVVGSAEALIHGLVEQIKAIGAAADAATQAKINDLVATLQANDKGLAQSVAANTIPPPAPAPAPNPVP